MKKTKQRLTTTNIQKAKKEENKTGENRENLSPIVNSLDNEEQGFGGWLRSSDGLETMKLFVIANSIVMLTTLVYPHLQTVFAIIYDMIYDLNVLYDD